MNYVSKSYLELDYPVCLSSVPYKSYRIQWNLNQHLNVLAIFADSTLFRHVVSLVISNRKQHWYVLLFDPLLLLSILYVIDPCYDNCFLTNLIAIHHTSYVA